MFEKLFPTYRRLGLFLFLAVAVLSIPFTLSLLSHQQDIRQHADYEDTSTQPPPNYNDQTQSNTSIAVGGDTTTQAGDVTGYEKTPFGTASCGPGGCFLANGDEVGDVNGKMAITNGASLTCGSTGCVNANGTTVDPNAARQSLGPGLQACTTLASRNGFPNVQQMCQYHDLSNPMCPVVGATNGLCCDACGSADTLSPATNTSLYVTLTPTPIQSTPTSTPRPTRTPTPIKSGIFSTLTPTQSVTTFMPPDTVTPIQSIPTEIPTQNAEIASVVSPTQQASQTTPGATSINLSIKVEGVGSNTTIGENPNPNPSTQYINVSIFDLNNNFLQEIPSSVNYDSPSSTFKNIISASIPSGTYKLKIRLGNTLWKAINNAVLNSQTTPISVSIVPGDLNSDNSLDLYDYNTMISCYGTSQCSQKTQADLNMDGKVDEQDLNILYSEFTNRQGD
ncbi:MAG TPA: dockerin type I domain-containing protein [Patescibacteria group bacterium]|nr:dockerin type I domain-containing protein [Patescibacteria group bacterium]